MNKRHTFLFTLLTLAMGSVALAADPNPFNLVNPLSMVADVDSKLRGTNLFAATMTLATAIAITGFFVKIYAAVGKNVMSEIRGVMVQGVGVALMLSLSGPIHGALTSTWNNAYNTSNAAFAGALGPKVEQAKTEMNKVVTTVGAMTVAGVTVGAAGGALGAAATGEATLGSAAASGASNVAGKALSRISTASMALSAFAVMYSGIIAIAAFIIMILGYLIPLVISFTMWGQVGPLWTAVGSALGAVFVAAMLPMLAYSAIDLTFVRSASQSQAVMDSSSLGTLLDGTNANLADALLKSGLEEQMNACANQQKDDPTKQCNLDTKSAIQKVWDKVKSTYDIAAGTFNSALLTIIKNVGTAILQVIFTALYFIIALVIMGAIVNLIVGILGGAASYVGAVAKGGG